MSQTQSLFEREYYGNRRHRLNAMRPIGTLRTRTTQHRGDLGIFDDALRVHTINPNHRWPCQIQYDMSWLPWMGMTYIPLEIEKDKSGTIFEIRVRADLVELSKPTGEDSKYVVWSSPQYNRLCISTWGSFVLRGGKESRKPNMIPVPTPEIGDHHRRTDADVPAFTWTAYKTEYGVMLRRQPYKSEHTNLTTSLWTPQTATVTETVTETIDDRSGGMGLFGRKLKKTKTTYRPR